MSTENKSFGIKGIAKALVVSIALVLVAPMAGVERLFRAIWKRDIFFAGHGEILSLIPTKLGRYLRNAYYFLTLEECPLDSCFMMGVMFTHSEAKVGHRIYVGAYSLIGMASIGDDVMISDHVNVLSGKNQHGTASLDVPFQQQTQLFTNVSIGNNTWIGASAVIMADVGGNCVIGAGSIVTKAVPDSSVAVGSPARVIRSTEQSLSESNRG